MSAKPPIPPRPRTSKEHGGYIRPITEGYDRKGGQNTTIQIQTRPAPPPPMKPAPDQKK